MLDIRSKLVGDGYIPWDKSWIIRMGILDLINCHKSIFGFLEARQAELSDDLLALFGALSAWIKGETVIDVGESATLYRCLRFASWKLGLAKNFIAHETLPERIKNMCSNPAVVRMPLKELLLLDGGTSQWASAAVLFGNTERVEFPPFKLELTYEAVEHWKERNDGGKSWVPRYDETISRQAAAFLQLLKHERTDFLWHHAEDYCFFRASGFLSKEQGESFFPSLHGHESDRIEEMEVVIAAVNSGQMILSKDHRAVQAGAMRQISLGREISVAHPECVSKSWPMFWDFLRDAPKLLKKT